MLFIKSLLGLAGVGVGAFVPVVTKRFEQVVPTEAVEFVKKLNVVKSVKKKLSENQTNVRLRMSLRSLKEKSCQLVDNPLNMNNSFDALHACKEGDKTVFYYLNSVDSFKKD
ncbi:hypothetical protein OVS_01735 [Mycoplasma ovis str. Michigan]|uniref:Uncharacterized protein n=1 Tax=Mycoplasma ovis str. Michigan TaxID=1415773 RepID=A0ABM5P179_9MOLU|nr:hypothetical protein [Mycoplasma ovis]AHC40232.1 hypothetical protein OVS_01735 [Mycoplasma ovis str. Michigan]